MNRSIKEYHLWMGKLGWVTPEQLSALTKDHSLYRSEGRPEDSTLRFLRQGVREGEFFTHKFDGTRAYTGNRARLVTAYHDFMSAQVVTKLWQAFERMPRVITNPNEFFEKGISVIPDFGLTVTLANGVHGFAIEYQTQQAIHTTKRKLGEYWTNFESVRQALQSDFLWTIFVLERPETWVEELARSVEAPTSYFVSKEKFFAAASSLKEFVFLKDGVHTPLALKL